MSARVGVSSQLRTFDLLLDRFRTLLFMCTIDLENPLGLDRLHTFDLVLDRFRTLSHVRNRSEGSLIASAHFSMCTIDLEPENNDRSC